MTDRSHYFKESPCKVIDVYRVLDLFGVKHPCLQHAIKKLLAAGQRGGKSEAEDVEEAIEALRRWQVMREEEAASEKERVDKGKAWLENMRRSSEHVTMYYNLTPEQCNISAEEFISSVLNCASETPSDEGKKNGEAGISAVNNALAGIRLIPEKRPTNFERLSPEKVAEWNQPHQRQASQLNESGPVDQ